MYGSRRKGGGRIRFEGQLGVLESLKGRGALEASGTGCVGGVPVHQTPWRTFLGPYTIDFCF